MQEQTTLEVMLEPIVKTKVPNMFTQKYFVHTALLTNSAALLTNSAP